MGNFKIHQTEIGTESLNRIKIEKLNDETSIADNTITNLEAITFFDLCLGRTFNIYRRDTYTPNRMCFTDFPFKPIRETNSNRL